MSKSSGELTGEGENHRRGSSFQQHRSCRQGVCQLTGQVMRGRLAPEGSVLSPAPLGAATTGSDILPYPKPYILPFENAELGGQAMGWLEAGEVRGDLAHVRRDLVRLAQQLWAAERLHELDKAQLQVPLTLMLTLTPPHALLSVPNHVCTACQSFLCTSALLLHCLLRSVRSEGRVVCYAYMRGLCVSRRPTD